MAKKRIITKDELDWQNSTRVISSAQKFILPIPNFGESGEQLNYSEEQEKAEQLITDNNGLVFFNRKDNCYQAVAGDDTDVVIFNSVTEEQAEKLRDKIAAFNENPNKLSLEQVKEIFTYAEELRLGDRYNSNVKFVQEKMSKVGKDTPYSNYRPAAKGKLLFLW